MTATHVAVGHSAWFYVWDVVKVVLILLLIWCIVLQRRALNPIAFGRSLFIAGSAIVMGFLVGLLPNVAATVFSVVLLVLGFGMILFMGYQSWQHLRNRKR